MNAEARQSLAHPHAQIAAPDARQSDFRRYNLGTLHGGGGACFINRFPDGGGGIADADTQRVRRPGHTFAEHMLAAIGDDRTCFRAAAVNSQNQIVRGALSAGTH
jgi:hypothetical protein